MKTHLTLLVASDHAGFELKEKLKERGAEIGVTFQDLGPFSPESVDYPDYANLLCKKLIDGGAGTPLGLLICGSGVGVSIAANRHSEIRAVLAESPEVARLGREHNHANVLCIGSRILDLPKALDVIHAFITAVPETGERHLRRIQKLKGTPA